MLGISKSFETHNPAANHELEYGSRVKTVSTVSHFRSRLSGRAAVLALLILAGCATAETEPAAPQASGPEGGPAAPDGGQSGPGSTDPSLADAADVAELTYVPPKEPVIDDDPERLIGLGTQGLSALLGEPALIRRESPAQVWQYQGYDCVFDVFFYNKNETDSVTYVEARDAEGNKTAPRACLNELLKARPAS